MIRWSPYFLSQNFPLKERRTQLAWLLQAQWSPDHLSRSQRWVWFQRQCRRTTLRKGRRQALLLLQLFLSQCSGWKCWSQQLAQDMCLAGRRGHRGKRGESFFLLNLLPHRRPSSCLLLPQAQKASHYAVKLLWGDLLARDVERVGNCVGESKM